MPTHDDDFDDRPRRRRFEDDDERDRPRRRSGGGTSMCLIVSTFNAAMADGSVRTFRIDEPPGILPALIIRNGGERVKP